MCLICVSMGKEIPEASLDNGWIDNSDGAGFSFVKDNRLFIRKGFTKYKSFLTAYEEQCIGNEHVVHFRKASVGTVIKKELTHPFLIHNKCALFYNGTIHGLLNDKTSDTGLLASLLNGLPYDFITDKKNDHLFNALIYGIIAKNKMVFHTVEDSISIFNKELGIDEDGIWYSNDSFKKKVTIITPPATQTGTTKCKICESELTEYDINNQFIWCSKCRIDKLSKEETFCEGCGHLYNIKDLHDGLCKPCLSTLVDYSAY